MTPDTITLPVDSVIPRRPMQQESKQLVRNRFGHMMREATHKQLPVTFNGIANNIRFKTFTPAEYVRTKRQSMLVNNRLSMRPTTIQNEAIIKRVYDGGVEWSDALLKESNEPEVPLIIKHIPIAAQLKPINQSLLQSTAATFSSLPENIALENPNPVNISPSPFSLSSSSDKSYQPNSNTSSSDSVFDSADYAPEEDIHSLIPRPLIKSHPAVQGIKYAESNHISLDSSSSGYEEEESSESLPEQQKRKIQDLQPENDDSDLEISSKSSSEKSPPRPVRGPAKQSRLEGSNRHRSVSRLAPPSSNKNGEILTSNVASPVSLESTPTHSHQISTNDKPEVISVSPYGLLSGAALEEMEVELDAEALLSGTPEGISSVLSRKSKSRVSKAMSHAEQVVSSSKVELETCLPITVRENLRGSTKRPRGSIKISKNGRLQISKVADFLKCIGRDRSLIGKELQEAVSHFLMEDPETHAVHAGWMETKREINDYWRHAARDIIKKMVITGTGKVDFVKLEELRKCLPRQGFGLAMISTESEEKSITWPSKLDATLMQSLQLPSEALLSENSRSYYCLKRMIVESMRTQKRRVENLLFDDDTSSKQLIQILSAYKEKSGDSLWNTDVLKKGIDRLTQLLGTSDLRDVPWWMRSLIQRTSKHGESADSFFSTLQKLSSLDSVKSQEATNQELIEEEACEQLKEKMFAEQRAMLSEPPHKEGDSNNEDEDIDLEDEESTKVLQQFVDEDFVSPFNRISPPCSWMESTLGLRHAEYLSLTPGMHLLPSLVAKITNAIEKDNKSFCTKEKTEIASKVRGAVIEIAVCPGSFTCPGVRLAIDPSMRCYLSAMGASIIASDKKENNEFVSLMRFAGVRKGGPEWVVCHLKVASKDKVKVDFILFADEFTSSSSVKSKLIEAFDQGVAQRAKSKQTQKRNEEENAEEKYDDDSQLSPLSKDGQSVVSCTFQTPSSFQNALNEDEQSSSKSTSQESEDESQRSPSVSVFGKLLNWLTPKRPKLLPKTEDKKTSQGNGNKTETTVISNLLFEGEEVSSKLNWTSFTENEKENAKQHKFDWDNLVSVCKKGSDLDSSSILNEELEFDFFDLLRSTARLLADAVFEGTSSSNGSVDGSIIDMTTIVRTVAAAACSSSKQIKSNFCLSRLCGEDSLVLMLTALSSVSEASLAYSSYLTHANCWKCPSEVTCSSEPLTVAVVQELLNVISLSSPEALGEKSSQVALCNRVAIVEVLDLLRIALLMKVSNVRI